MLKLTYELYFAFDVILVNAVRISIGDPKGLLSKNAVWKQFADTLKGAELLRGFTKNHLARKFEDRKPADKIPISTELFCRLMEFIRQTNPDALPNPPMHIERLMYHLQAERWGQAFIDQYFPGRPELIDHFRLIDNGDPKRKVSEDKAEITDSSIGTEFVFNNSLFTRPVHERLWTLNNTVYTIVYQQGEMLDYGVVSFRIKAPNEIYGEYRILYQQEDRSYPWNPEVLSMKGLLFGSDMVVLILVNNNIARTHVCTMQLFYDSNLDLKGNFIVDYREGKTKDIPEERKGMRTGEITYIKSTPEAAGQYLEKSMEGKERKNEFYNYKGSNSS